MCSCLWTTRGRALASLVLSLSYLSVSSALHGGNSFQSSKENTLETFSVATCEELRQAVEQNRAGLGQVSGTTPPKLLITITAETLVCNSFHSLEGLEFEILPSPGDESSARMNKLPVADNGVLRLPSDGSVAGSIHSTRLGSYFPAFGSVSARKKASRRLEDGYDDEESQLGTVATPSPVAAAEDEYVTEETSDTNPDMYSSPSPVAMSEVETPADSTTPSPSLGESENPEYNYPTPPPVEQAEEGDSNPTTSAENDGYDYSTPTPVNEDGAYLSAPTASPLASDENVATTSPNPLLGEPGAPEETPTALPTSSPLEMPSTAEELTYPSPSPAAAEEKPEPDSSYPSATSSPSGASSTPEGDNTPDYTLSPTSSPLAVPTPAPLAVPTPAPLAVPTPTPLAVSTPWPTGALFGEGEYGEYGSGEGAEGTDYYGEDDFEEEIEGEGYYGSQESGTNDETWYEEEAEMGDDDFNDGEGYVDGSRSTSSAAAAGSDEAGAYEDEEKDPAVDDNAYVVKVAAGMLAAVAVLGLGAFVMRRRRQRTLRGEFRNVPHHGLGNADNL